MPKIDYFLRNDIVTFHYNHKSSLTLSYCYLSSLVLSDCYLLSVTSAYN